MICYVLVLVHTCLHSALIHSALIPCSPLGEETRREAGCPKGEETWREEGDVGWKETGREEGCPRGKETWREGDVGGEETGKGKEMPDEKKPEERKDISEEKKLEKKVMPEEKKPEERKDVPEEKKIEKKVMPEEKKNRKRGRMSQRKRKLKRRRRCRKRRNRKRGRMSQRKRNLKRRRRCRKRRNRKRERMSQRKRNLKRRRSQPRPPRRALQQSPTRVARNLRRCLQPSRRNLWNSKPDNGGKPADQDGKVMEKSGPKMALHPADKCETDKIPAANASKSGSKAVSKPETVDSKEIKEPKCSEIKNSEDARKILPGVPSTVPKPKVKTAAKSKSRNTAKPNVSKPSSSTPKVLKRTTKTSKKETMEKDSIEKKLHCVSKLLLDFCGKAFLQVEPFSPLWSFQHPKRSSFPEQPGVLCSPERCQSPRHVQRGCSWCWPGSSQKVSGLVIFMYQLFISFFLGEMGQQLLFLVSKSPQK